MPQEGKIIKNLQQQQIKNKWEQELTYEYDKFSRFVLQDYKL